MSPDYCPNCGAEIPSGAKACPACGSCEETGWSEAATAQRLDLPDDNFDYNDFVQREFGGEMPKSRGLHWVWWLTAILLVLLLLLFFIW